MLYFVIYIAGAIATYILIYKDMGDFCTSSTTNKAILAYFMVFSWLSFIATVVVMLLTSKSRKN